MDITRIIDILPDSVKVDVVAFQSVKLKTGKRAERVLLDRVLTDKEKEAMETNKRIIQANGLYYPQYAPEIKKSYIIVKH